MGMVIPKNGTVAAERRIPFVLVDATDLITPEDITVTGVKVDLSFAGAADAPSTNDIVKVDATRGMYYIELTQTESNTALGSVQGYLKPTGCAACYIEGQIGPLSVNTASLTATEIADAQLDEFIAWLQDAGFSRPTTSGNATLKNSAGVGQTVAITTDAAALPIISAT